MNKIVHDLGLDAHKESISVFIALQNSTAVRRYGIIGGTLDPFDKLIKGSTRCDADQKQRPRSRTAAGLLHPTRQIT
jgi:hypothetical protein